MKMNLKKALVVTTILSSSTVALGISFFIVGGYGNNINSLSEIQNSGYFGLNTAFEKENTTTINTKEKYVEHLKTILKAEAAKKETQEYKDLEIAIDKEEKNIIVSEGILAPLREAVKVAQDKFNNDRTNENKTNLNLAQEELKNSPANGQIEESRKIINNNNEIIAKINLSQSDISRISNYSMWNSLFIVGSALLAIGSILAVTSTSYLVYLKKNEKETTK